MAATEGAAAAVDGVDGMDKTQESMTDDGTLTTVMDGAGVPFDAAGEQFTIRQPTTEEYDDALAIQNLVLRRTLALPELAELKLLPCSDEERASYEALIAAAELQFAEAPEGRQKEELVAEIARLEQALEKRTLADEIAGRRATTARDRWLTMRLLCDKDGRPVFDTKAADIGERWEALPMVVKDAARPAVWAVLAWVRTAPFSWGLLRKPR